MQLDWWTLGLQAVNFLVLVWLLWRFLFRPVKRIIVRREEVAAAARGELEEAKQQAEKEKADYEAARAELAEERREMLEKLRSEIAQEREGKLEEAQAKAEQIVKEAREQATEERKQARKALKSEIAELAVDMAAHLLRTIDTEAYDSLLLNGIWRRLAELSSAERRRLQNSLEADNARIVVTTAQPLSEAAQADWAEKVRKALGQDEAGIAFREDKTLIGGAEVELPHDVVKFSLADQLARSKDALEQDGEAAG